MDNAKLKNQISDTLKPLLLNAKSCVLLDFPNHSNVGDSAIWLGTLSFLQSISLPVVATCTRRIYPKRAISRAVSEGAVILINGGGNFGDLWIDHHLLRLKIIEDFPDTKIIQLPVSTQFSDRDLWKHTQTVLNRHRKLTLLARDRKSFEMTRRIYNGESVLCPDMVHWLRAHTSTIQATRDVLYLMRNDHEADPEETDGEDWLSYSGTLKEEWYGLALLFSRHRALKLLNRRASKNLFRGWQLISSAKCLVSDRLHANLLADLIQIPHAALDTQYGKVHSYYQTWGIPSNCVLANTVEEGMKKLANLTSSSPRSTAIL